MFCSTIIPTIGRPTLSRAIHSVLDQKFTHDDYEVIVVNDSGKPLLDEPWQKSAWVQIINTNRHNRSVARNSGAAIAKGKYLHFLDDDDWMLPGVFENFWEMANTNQAAWLYGAFRLVDDADTTITEIFPDETGNCLMPLIAWEWLPLQASLIESKAFFAVGGFASLESLLGGFEDVDLSRQIACKYDMARLNRVVTCIRVGTESSTTNYSNMFSQNRQSREKTLNTPGTFARMRASAQADASRPGYWYGKIIYYYLASTKWHFEHKRLFSAANRTVYTLASLVTAGRYIFSADFWHGVLKPHYPRMGIALQESGASRLYQDITWRQ